MLTICEPLKANNIKLNDIAKKHKTLLIIKLAGFCN